MKAVSETYFTSLVRIMRRRSQNVIGAANFAGDFVKTKLRHGRRRMMVSVWNNTGDEIVITLRKYRGSERDLVLRY